jgi:hypothetical protein
LKKRIVSLGRVGRRAAARRMLFSLAALGCAVGFAADCVSAAERTEISASDFVNMIGVGVHMRYTDGAYADTLKVIEDITFLGIRRVRDDLPGNDTRESLHARDMLKRMAFDRIRFNLIFPGRWKESGAIDFLKILEMAVPGSVASVEGYNEINNVPVTFDGLGGVAGAAAGQRAIYQAIKSNPALSHVPVIDMTGFVEVNDSTFNYGASLKGYADVMNMHSYAQNGAQPGGWINAEKLGHYKAIEEPMPKVITEFGYASMPQSGWLVIGVDERTQAKGILNGLFDAARSGYDGIYIYELLDQKPDPEQKELEFHFGLFDFDNRPKLAAGAIRNLTAILGGGMNAGRKMPNESVRITVEAPESGEQVRSLGLRKSNGTQLAAIWRETPFWDRASGQPLEATSVPAKISFGRSCSAIKSYDLLQSSEPVATAAGGVISVNVGDYVQLVECLN